MITPTAVTCEAGRPSGRSIFIPLLGCGWQPKAVDPKDRRWVSAMPRAMQPQRLLNFGLRFTRCRICLANSRALITSRIWLAADALTAGLGIRAAVVSRRV